MDAMFIEDIVNGIIVCIVYDGLKAIVRKLR